MKSLTHFINTCVCDVNTFNKLMMKSNTYTNKQEELAIVIFFGKSYLFFSNWSNEQIVKYKLPLVLPKNGSWYHEGIGINSTLNFGS